MNDLPHHAKSPCAKCPYKLGLVHTLTNPCPQCRENGYQTFEQFKNNYQKKEINNDNTRLQI